MDLKGLADLARHTSIPLSVDESVSTSHSLLEVISERAASIVQTKTGKMVAFSTHEIMGNRQFSRYEHLPREPSY